MNLKRILPWLLGGIGLLVLVIALSPWLINLLWCWGYFGRDSLIFQYWWQCGCPTESESVRYAPYRILSPACSQTRIVDILQDNRTVLAYRELSTPPAIQRELLKIDVNQETNVLFDLGGRSPNNIYLLNDKILLIRYDPRSNYAFVDLTTGLFHEVASVGYEPVVFEPMQTDFEILEQLKSKDLIFVPERSRLVIGTTADFDAQKSIVIYSNTGGFPSVIKFLEDNNIVYYSLDWGFTPQFQSPDGRLEAKLDGVYIADTDQKIVSSWQPKIGDYNARGFKPQFWSSDGRKVIYGQGGYNHIYNSDVFGSHWPVPQPILILDIPPEYWPAPTP